MSDTKSLLLIEDEPAILRFLKKPLEADGWRFYPAKSGQIGIGLAATQKPDLILLDMSLENSLDVLASLRPWAPVPIIVFSSQTQEGVNALNLGADDYLNKPFDVAELRARLNLALRHSEKWAQEALPVYEHDGLCVDLRAHRVRANKKEVHLSPLQYQFLAALVRNAGRVVSWRQLTETVWGKDHKVKAEKLRTLVCNLRQKIEADSAKPRWLKTEPGIGYKLESPHYDRRSYSAPDARSLTTI